jgi:hypothetical protein
MPNEKALAYIRELAQSSGLTQEQLDLALKVLDNDKFAQGLVDGQSRQSDYSRNMDELRRQKSELDASRTQWTEWYERATANDMNREKELQEWRAGQRTKDNPGTHGNSGGSSGSGTNGSGLTREELETALKQRDALTLNITKQMGRLASRHAAKFGEELDVDAIEKIAIDKGMRVEQAYDEWIKPRIEAKAKADAEASVKEAYERGLKEGMSKHDVPLEASKGHHVFFDRKAADPTKPLSDRDRAANFVNAWREAAEQTK